MICKIHISRSNNAVQEIKTNRNKEWSKSSIRFILLNSKNVTNGFIEEDIFDSEVKLLNDNKK